MAETEQLLGAVQQLTAQVAAMQAQLGQASANEAALQQRIEQLEAEKAAAASSSAPRVSKPPRPEKFAGRIEDDVLACTLCMELFLQAYAIHLSTQRPGDGPGMKTGPALLR